MSVDGATESQLEIHTLGSGPNVVVLPGFVTNDMTPGLTKLATKTTLHLVELPGFGHTSIPGNIRTPLDIACMVKDTLRAHGLLTASLVGQSFGGWVAAELAGIAPVNRLVLIDPFGLRIVGEPRVDMFDMTREQVLDLVYGDRSKAPTTWTSPSERAGYAAVARFAWNPYLCDLSLPNRLEQLDVPTMVVWGSDDRVVPVTHAALFGDLIRSSRVEILPNSGHDPSCDQPEKFAQIVGDFLTETESFR